MSRLVPGQPVPALELPLVEGEHFSLAQSNPQHFTLLMFYRGNHCPICRNQLNDLKANLGKLSELGVEPVAISMDGKERATKSLVEWDLGGLPIAYALTEEKARAFGLYITEAISDTEPRHFSEPGLFLIKPDGTLYFASVQTSPFTRPALAELMQGIGYANGHGYPARGTVV
ncbi:MAG: AhpC/TSA family protein [Sphingomonadaceae bacterium]|nr:AhpC/TSA family protein [Sphingomonadaceae bacterium]